LYLYNYNNNMLDFFNSSRSVVAQVLSNYYNHKVCQINKFTIKKEFL
jgi:hypothetical protein